MGELRHPEVTLFLPTWNAGPEFPENFQAMREQELDRPFEIVIIDSGSTDGTLEFLEKQDVRLSCIPNSEFNHGLTRNKGIEQARGEIVVLAVQDSRPKDRHWMQRLVDCYADPEVAGAYSRQLPRPDATPFIRNRLEGWGAMNQGRRVQSVSSVEEFEALEPMAKLELVTFDNVSSSVRRSVALEIPFRDRQFGEDMDWAQRAMLAGWKLVFEPRSQIVHSHNKSMWYEFKRTYLDHQNRFRLFGIQVAPNWSNVFVNTRVFARHCRTVVASDATLTGLKKLKWRTLVLPWAFTQNVAQFFGARSPRKLEEGSWFYKRLDRVMRRGV